MSELLVVIALLSGGHYLGDDNNVLGISRALRALGYLDVRTINVIQKDLDGSFSLDDQQIQEIQNLLAKQAYRTVVIGAGIDGMEALNALEKSDNNMFVWSGHQLINSVRNNLPKLDAVVLPESSINHPTVVDEFEQKKVKLISTVGVPHNRTQEDIIQNYKQWIENVSLPEHVGFILVSLPGDAVDEFGQMQYYSRESAAQLGETLGEFARSQNKIILATNGPRTGQHDPISQQKLNTHQKNSDLDLVSQSFLESAQKELGDSEKIIFADFKFGTPSLFNAFLGAVYTEKNSIAVIGGESTSQVTEATNLLPLGTVYVVNHEAMNSNHHKYINQVLSLGYAQELSNLGLRHTELAESESVAVVSDSHIAAEAISDMMSAKNRNRFR